MQWDAHKHLKQNHEKMAGHSDVPIAALLQDLKQRGLLERTLVIWGAEFGRLPTSEAGNGRDHNPHGYTMWFAGGGVRGGQAIGATDEFGLHAVDRPFIMRDFHASILHALGLDQNQLWYLHNGRHEKLTDFGGRSSRICSRDRAAGRCSPDGALVPVPAQARPPNIVVLLADNLGYGDTEPFGSQHHRTPSLKRMAGKAAS